MPATFLYGAGDVRVDTRPDPVIQQPTDAVERVVLSASVAVTCGRTSRCPA